MKIEMREDRHLWVTMNPEKGDPREIIVDKEEDVRVCDGETVVKVRFQGTRILDVLINDVVVRPCPPR